MTMCVRSLVLGGVTLALGLCLLASSGSAADKKNAGNKKVQDAVGKVADAVQKKDEEGAKKGATAIKADVDDIMSALKQRNQGGLGIGVKAGVFTPDHIEGAFVNFEKRVPTPKILKDRNDDLVRACYITAAIALAVKDRCPVKKKTGDKDPEKWKQWSDDMYTNSMALAEAIKEQKAADIKAAAKKLNDSCAACHSPFKKND
jgi:cytochrome c556